MPTKHKTVLVVDDNRDAADVVAFMIRAKGHMALTAYDTPSGLKLAAQLKPDIIFHDIGLPDIDGYVAATQFRADPQFKDTLLVALTAWARPEDRERAREAGFDLHIEKPMRADQLDDILQS